MRTDFNPVGEVKTALAIITEGKEAKVEDPITRIHKITGIAPVAIRRGLNKLQQSNNLKIVFVKNTNAQQIDYVQLEVGMQKHLKRRFETEPKIQEEVNKIKLEAENKQAKQAKILEAPTEKTDTIIVKSNGIRVRKLGKKPAPVEVSESDQPDKQSKDKVKTANVAHSASPIGSYGGLAGIVDYDNIKASEQELHYDLSFSKMKKFLQSMNQKVMFAEVFLSPHSNSQRVIDKLWHCGWLTVSCPHRIKDKDSVDMKMKWRVMSFLDLPGIDTIVVFSNDRDFDDLVDKASDYGKRLIIVGSAVIKENCEGKDEIPDKILHRNVLEFIKCFQFVQNGYQPVSGRDKRICELFKTTINHLASVNGEKYRGFRTVSNNIRETLIELGFNDFNKDEYNVLVRALIEQKVIYPTVSNTGPNGTMYYHIDHDHIIFEKQADKATH